MGTQTDPLGLKSVPIQAEPEQTGFKTASTQYEIPMEMKLAASMYTARICRGSYIYMY